MARYGVISALLVIGGCGVELAIPADANVTCTTDADCPKSSICDANLCTDPATLATKPSLNLVGDIARTTGVVSISLRTYDGASDPTTIVAEAEIAGVFVDIELDDPVVESSPDGFESTVHWDAPTFFGSTDLVTDLRLRLTPTNGRSIGPSVISDPFDFGNDAPQIAAVALDLDDGVASGDLVVWLTVSDSSLDPLIVHRFELVTDSGTIAVTLDAASFPAGMTVEPSTDAQSIVWNTGVDAAIAEADVRLRVVVADQFDATSEPGESALFEIDNSPRLALTVTSPAAGSRFVDTIPIPFSVSDANGAAPVNDTVTLSFEYALPATPDDWHVAAAHTSSDPVANLDGLGASGNFVWDALAAAHDTAAGTLSVSPHGDYVGFHDGVLLRVTATDDSSLTTEASVTLTIGNDAPEVELSDFVGAFTCTVPLEFSLWDNAHDVAGVEIAFRLNGESEWRNALVGSGVPDGLATVSTRPGREHVLTWDSCAQPSTDLTEAQGIGRDWLSNVELRVRGYDAPEDKVMPYFGPWSAQKTIAELRNQTPPTVDQLVVHRYGDAGGASPFAVTFRLSDVESDPADIRVEMTFDGGATWRQMRELAVPESCGFNDLATEPQLFDGSGGVRHAIMLDPTGVNLIATTQSALRIVATDGFGSPLRTTEAVTFLERPAGPLGVPPNDTLFSTDTWPTSSWAGDIAVADFDGDEILDLALGVGSATTGGIQIYLGDGDGTFTTVGPLMTLAATQKIATGLIVADFDGDGELDLAAANANSEAAPDEFGVLLGNGDGTFASSVSYPTDNWPYALAAADFNGDDVLDLVVSNHYADTIGIYIGAGDGTFGTAATRSAGDTPSGVAVGDFDGDTYQDIVVTSSESDELLLFFGDGAGGFLAGPSVAAGDYPFVIEALDLDGDLVLDLVVLNARSDDIHVYSGDGLGGFSLEWTARAIGSNGLSVGDVNGDFVADLAVAMVDDNEVRIYLAEGGGSAGNLQFAEPAPFPVAGGPRYLAVADFNGDTMPDIAVPSWWESTVTVLSGTTNHGVNDATFADSGTFPIGSLPKSLLARDLNQDGLLDIAAVNDDLGDNGNVSISLAEGYGGLGGGTLAAAGTYRDVGRGPYGAAPADFNEDGILDLAISGGVSGDVYILEGTATSGAATGEFSRSVALRLGNWIESVVTADFNGDQHADLATVSWSDDELYVVLGNGDGTFVFAPGSPFTTAENPRHLTSADFNGDGVADLAISCFAGRSVQIFLGVGDGGFNQAPDSPYSFGIQRVGHVAAADLDGDGILDLAVSNADESSPPVTPRVTLYFGDGVNGVGDGTFTEGPALVPAGTPSDILVADFNGGGILDLLVTTFANDGPEFSLFVGGGAGGVGDGNFASAVPLEMGVNAKSPAMGDFDQDGVPDFAIIETTTPDSFRLFHGQLQEFSPAWAKPLATCSTAHDNTPCVVGPDPFQPGRDRFDGARHDYLSQYLYRFELARELRASGLTLPVGMKPLTHPWTTTGDVRWIREQVATAEGVRIRVANRLNPRTSDGSPLPLHDLSPAVFASQSGIVVDLPISNGRSNADITSAVAVRVFCRAPEWVRANDFADDTLFGQASAADYLPRVLDGAGAYRDVIIERPHWFEAPADDDGDFATAHPTAPANTGPRFVLITEGPENKRRVRLLTDRLGVCQAYLEL